MRFLNKAREYSNKVLESGRDRTRDEICAGLQELGIDARLAPPKRPEEQLKRTSSCSSLGIIDVHEGLIRWVNVQIAQGGVDSREIYTATFGVPDPKITPDFPKVRIKSVRIRKPRFLGNVVDLAWKGNEFELGVVNRLAEERWPLLMGSRNDLDLMAHPGHGCWTISHGRWSWTFPQGRWGRAFTPKDDEMGERGIPSLERWEFYQYLAKLLIDVQRSPSR